MKHILVVDDSAVVRKIVRGMLAKMNFKVTEAENGSAALQICTESKPDGIVLDWNMPVMDGLSFLKSLRERLPDDMPKVIFCTTENHQANIISAMTAGADEYIMKPFNEDIMREKLEQVGLV